MAGRFSDTYAGFLLDGAFGSARTADFPATVYLGLSTTLPSNTGTNITEPSGAGYARVALTNNDTNFPDSGSDRIKANGTVITYPQPTGSWGTVAYFVFMTALTGGVMVAWGSLDVPRTIGAANDPPSFAIGALVITAPGA